MASMISIFRSIGSALTSSAVMFQPYHDRRGHATLFFRRSTAFRAALKLGRRRDQANDVPGTAAHFGQEGGTGAIPGAWLAAHPGPRFSLYGATQKAQNGGRDGMANATTVFARADIQRVMGAIFKAPVLARQFQEPGRLSTAPAIIRNLNLRPSAYKKSSAHGSLKTFAEDLR